MLNIYDLCIKNVRTPIDHSDGWVRWEYLDYNLRTIARSRGHARALAVRFMKNDGASIDFTYPCSIRKIGTAWNDAQPDCDWPMAFEYGCAEQGDF